MPAGLLGRHDGAVERRVGLLNRGQRVVLSIGLAAALGAVGRAVEVWGAAGGGGWFGYAPGTRASFVPGQPFLLRHPALDLLWWLFLIGLWVAVSVRLFANDARQDEPPAPPRP
jgi:hypothetical protein